MESTGIERGIRTTTLNSWEEFPDLVRERFLVADAIHYRGQASSEWGLISSLDRLLSGKPNHENRHQHQLDAYKDAVRGLISPSDRPPDDKEWWALAQHHGLKTPLLDFTRSPFIALYFAFEQEKISNQTDEHTLLQSPEMRSVYGVSFSMIDRVTLEEVKEKPTPYSPKSLVSQRLTAQSGVFLKMPIGCDLMSYMKDNIPYPPPEPGLTPLCFIDKIDIPNEDRDSCLNYLNLMGINRMTLFPDLDGAAEYVNTIWEKQRIKTSLGRF